MTQQPSLPGGSATRRASAARTPRQLRCGVGRSLAAALCAGALATGPAPSALAQPVAGSSPAVKGRTPVTLNFVNADIEAVSRAIGVMLDRQIQVDPRVRGNITLYSEQPLAVRDAYLNYLSALRGLGFAVVEAGGLLKVVPEADAKLQTGTVSIGEPSRRGDQIVTQIFRLNHENANNLVAILRPLISPNNTINANPGSNSLVITDYAENLQRLAKIISTLDSPAATDVEVIPLKYAIAPDLAPMVQRLADGGGGGAAGVPGGTPGVAASAGGISVLADARANALIVRAPNQTRLFMLKSLIEKLDRPTAPGGGPAGNIWVVHLRNADATKLAQVLRAAYDAGVGGGGGGGSSGSSGGFGSQGSSGGFGNTSSSFGNNQNIAQSQANAGGMGSSSSAATSPLSPSAGPSTGGFIQADPSTNSLIITAPEPAYRQIRAMIDALDSRRAQIYIESMIVEVSGDNAADFGFQWQGLLGREGDSNGLYGGTNFGSTGNLLSLTLGSLGVGSSSGTTGSTGTSGISLGEGLNLGLIHNFSGTYGLAAIARLLQSQTNTNIISTPNLITLDNEEAKIIVGSNVPFVTGQYSSTGTGNLSNPFQTIERKDVGITLRIKPQVGEGGSVRMTIFQESSSVSDRVAPGTTNAGPSTDKRSIESTVVVDDGAILVLGGLIEDRFEESKSKIPLLGDLPVVGALFRSESREKRRTNLMVFLRPIVMRDSESATALTMDRYDLIRAQQKDAQPRPSIVMPINESPVLPPQRPPGANVTPDVPRDDPSRLPPLNPPPGASAPAASAEPYRDPDAQAQNPANGGRRPPPPPLMPPPAPVISAPSPAPTPSTSGSPAGDPLPAY